MKPRYRVLLVPNKVIQITYQEIKAHSDRIARCLYCENISWGVKKLLLKVIEKIA